MTDLNDSESLNESELLDQKISAHNNFCAQLKLDRNRSGGELATLIEDLIETHPINWQEELGKILQEASRLEKEVSLQDSMFYLGDIIEALDVKKMNPITIQKQKIRKTGRAVFGADHV